MSTMTQKINSNMFRAYDIRGIYEVDLTEDTVYQIGRAIGSELKDRGLNQIVVARDGRLSGPILERALCQGLIKSGCDVYQIGMVPTPVLYYATETFGITSGVMITGSHNPKEYNGLKIVLDNHTLTEDQIQSLLQRILNENYHQGHGTLHAHDLKDHYLKTIASDVSIKRPLKVVVDAGNGVAGELAPQLYQLLGCDVLPIYCDIDGNFPNHHPDPSQPHNLVDLIERVKQEQADVGLAFDGDGDRLGIVTNQGEVIWPDRQLMLFAREILKTHPGETIVFDVKCSKHVQTVIEEHRGKALMYRTGHSLMKGKMKEINAIFAGEMSGHLFFNDHWYGFDDALYTGARFLEILSQTTLTADALFQAIPNSISTPEIPVAIEESDKFKLMETLAKETQFDEAKIILIDGLRIEFSKGWALIRASNTTANLTLRFEADTQDDLLNIQNIIKALLQEHRPQLKLPF